MIKFFFSLPSFYVSLYHIYHWKQYQAYGLYLLTHYTLLLGFKHRDRFCFLSLP